MQQKTVSVIPGQHSLDAYSDESFRNAYDNNWIEMSLFTYQAKRDSLIILPNQNK